MMGAETISSGQKQNEYFKHNLLGNMQQYFKLKLHKKLSYDFYNVYSLIKQNDQDRLKFSKTFQQMKKQNNFDPKLLDLNLKQSRGIASMLGLCISDALGASTEFIPFDKKRNIIKDGFQDIKELIKKKILSSRCGRIGIWTDDASMSLAMAYSLLYKKYQFDPIHIRYMFILWLQNGLANGGREHSIGLGGNISISMNQFMQNQTDYAQQGSGFNNGNGSLMRLASVPLAYSDNIQKAIEYSGKQSKTTHNGKQAEQCSKLLAAILFNLINREENQDYKKVIDRTCQEFQTSVETVKYLALSKKETKETFDQMVKTYKGAFFKFNKSTEDRNWNWKDENFTYSPTRNKQQPGYIGSYCMDALAMALHTVWFTSSFKQCAILNANFGGDCDTVGAIAGQLAGAIYGVDKHMLKLYSEMVDFTEQRYEAFLVAYKLAYKKNVIQQIQQQKDESKEPLKTTQKQKQQDSQMEIQK